MKHASLVLSLLLCTLFFECATRHKITYNIPANYPEAKRGQLLTSLDKGKELYKTNCSECHGIFTQGKDKIPNFTNTQVDNYSMMFLRRDPKNHAVSRKMSPEQLNEVFSFLKYIKRDSVINKRRRI